jgi:hypothetical protein
MAVDANVLIYERLREETAAGKSIATALEAAYDKAFSAIFDANVTTLITAVILFWQATGSVKGFAVTLTLGIIASMFSALLVTKTAFRWLIEKFGLKKLSMLDLIPKRKFDFLGKRRIAAILSLALIAGSFIIFAVRGERNFGIDFRRAICSWSIPSNLWRSPRPPAHWRIGGRCRDQFEREECRIVSRFEAAGNIRHHPFQLTNLSRSQRFIGRSGKRRTTDRAGVRKKGRARSRPWHDRHSHLCHVAV